ncbi:MAG: response regulator, partial [Lachnospiraceae bacterium]|nr:response regulator [Lachnospiraceae bacterium]
MTPEFLSRIFQPFEREASNTISRIEGTGLGMAITKKLIEMMGGTIHVTSTLHEGSEFTIALPLKRYEADTSHFSALSGLHVLIMQGDGNKLNALPQLLRGLGITYDIAADGNQAIDRINDADISGREYFALLTADHLGDIDIAQLLPDIRARKGKDFPILMLSENNWSDMEYFMTKLGVNAFIPLPLFQSRLAEALYPFTRKEHTAKKEQPHGVADYSKNRLLLVEDNMLNLEIAKEILSMTNIKIDTATNGEEAIAAFCEKPPFYYDLILMDIKMPVMDGLEATRHIRQLPRPDASQVPIVAMTANAFAEDRQISIEAGMNAHITKPLDVEQVLGCLDTLKRESHV